MNTIDLSAITITAIPDLNTTEKNLAFGSDGSKFPYVIVMIVFVWLILGLAYAFLKWQQRPRNMYIIPRVFVLCSPRNVQFHYELIFRIGLPSYNFKPDKYDIDATILGHQKNEVVPMTRLSTRTLLDEPLITCLSIIVYRLVEMPPIGGLVLKHSGPFKSWLYIYDFTIIDLATNRELYFPLNQYIGSMDRVLPLETPEVNLNLHYPIDDVPMPEWTIEDCFLFLYTSINCIMLIVTMMPINCTYYSDTLSVVFCVFGGGTLVFFLDWLIYYHMRWNQNRREYFNDFTIGRYCPNETIMKITLASIASLVGGCCIYFSIGINEWKNALVWLLAMINSCTMVIGIWNALRLVDFGESIVACGLSMRGINNLNIGMRYSDMVADIQTKSGSTSGGGSTLSVASKKSRSVGPRSSIKSFGFDPITRYPSRKIASTQESRVSATGATPNNQPSMNLIRRVQNKPH